MDRLSARDVRYLEMALRLARKCLGQTFPNPMVGAVVVRRDRIVGQGYHRKAGSAHAEIEALAAAGVRANGATLYVNLEPCSHWGRTPPCVDAIIQAKIQRVVCCMCDPNPRVGGAGVRRLSKAGIKVSVGGLVKEAEALNEGFLFFHRHRRPFVAIKFAASLDGKIATHTGDSKWITNTRARAYARALRTHYQAILVGINTVLKDDPHLGLRAKGKPDPLRIILDSALKVPLHSKVLRDTNVLIFTTRHADKAKYKKLVDAGISVVTCAGNSISVRAVLKELARRNVISVFVEGGGRVLGSFVDAGLVDKMYVFYAPLLIGGETSKSAIGGRGANKVREALQLTRITRKTFGDNTLVVGYPEKGRSLV
ncbi:riboflavin biosynthesis protein RibD [Candidatus Kaiserbacteria bacterium RIFCSPHIGHO2_02_FULL_55_20]|uniref:Riboflavin biosynthesis protein RibD n=1 Tax=Candidatus Kaiserbacteria bacterium RIFCSPHIGHO2_02_FULL_55_20 TaxID=1798497 RepID=A0A1F6DXS7_9BACT|nr:MAG: riboflavin biosynthesis protein RibD [Candidatus Kaiserbacteria bacterium RIFCSPHIGHO2_02_FULL_55_20]